MPASKRLFCFGLGYCGQALAVSLMATGWQVTGTCRTEAACRALRGHGIDAWPFDRSGMAAEAAEAMAAASYVLNSVPPDDQGDPVLELCGAALAARDDLVWFGYLSTTGVYGDHGGGWVDEATSVSASTPRGRRRIDAERGWLALHRDRGLPAHLFRLAGIYGPGRNQLETLRAGKARRIVKPGQVFSRIHVDDIVATLCASMAAPRPGAAYNVCDDEAAPPQDVVAYAADLLGLEPPPEIAFEDAELSPMARSFYAENKRVRNDRIKSELGVRLSYPDYRRGLQALL